MLFNFVLLLENEISSKYVKSYRKLGLGWASLQIILYCKQIIKNVLLLINLRYVESQSHLPEGDM
jgi:hypothetical protein